MKYNKYTLLFFVLLLGINSTFGQFKNDTIVHKYPLNKGLGKQVFSTKNLLVFGGLLGTAFITDKWVNSKFKHNKTRFLTNYTDIFNEFGEKKYVVPAVVTTWAIGTIIKDEQLSTTAMNSCKALLFGAIATESIKIISGRTRPDANMGTTNFNFFKGTVNRRKSFPSGHAFVAWAAFTPFAETYSKWIYAIPISVGLARAYRNRHWFSDVVLGGGLGFFAGIYFHKRKNQRVIFNGNGIVIKF